MASSLAQQLANAKLIAGDAPGAKKMKGKPSLLFEFQKAADVDLQTLYEVGCQGFEDLVRREPRFNTLRDALFSRAASSHAREQLTSDAVVKLDAAVSDFCCLLSQHFLAPGCFKALEYLIRRFKINEHNIDALMTAALPYHATNEFVRLLQVLLLDPQRGRWAWLARAQGPGAALPREVLVARCNNDERVLGFVLDAARRLGTDPDCAASAKAFLSFYAATLCEMVAGAKLVDEQLLSRLLPYISAGLEAGACSDYRAATLMVVAELAGRAKLGKDFVKAIVNSMLRHMDPESPEAVRTALLVLAHLAVTQPQFDKLPEKALKALLSAPGLVELVEGLAEVNVRVAPLLALVTRSAAHRLAGNPESFQEPLLQLVHTGLLEGCAQALAAQLLQAASGLDAGTPARDSAAKVLRALDLRYPTQVDAAVNAALAPLRKNAESKAAEGEESDEEDMGDGAPHAAAQAVYQLVKTALGHSVRAPCGDSAMTLAAAAVAPAASMRKMALVEAGAILAKGDLPDESAAQLQACVMNGLSDDDMDVVATAIGLPCLASLPAAALLPALRGALHRIAGLLVGPIKAADSKQAMKAARGAARKALELLAQVAEEAKGTGLGQEALDEALLFIFQFVLPARRAPKVTKAAVAAAEKLDHPLSKAIARMSDLAAAVSDAADEVPAEAAGAGKGAKAKAGKKDKKGGDEPATAADKWALKALQKERVEAAACKFEAAAVEAMAKALGSHPAILVPEAVRLMEVARAGCAQMPSGDSNHPGGDAGLLRARHVMLLVMNTTLSKAAPRFEGHSGAAIVAATTSQALVDVCLKELTALPEASLADWNTRVETCLDGAGLPRPAHAQALLSEPATTHGAVLCHALQIALTMAAVLKDESGSAEAGGRRATMSEIFQELAALSPAGALDAHLYQLLMKDLPTASDYAAFLADMYAAPANSVAPAVQCSALRLQHSIPGTGSSMSGASDVMHVLRHVPHLLAAASNPDKAVRTAALDAVSTAAGALSSQPNAHPACQPVSALLTALGAHRALVEADGDAVASLLRHTLVPGSAAVAAAPAPAPASKKKGAAPQPAAASTVPPLVPADVAQAAFVHLAHLLPACSGSPAATNAAHALLEALLPLPGSEKHAVASADHRAALVPACVLLLKALLALSPRALDAQEAQLAATLVRVVFTTDGVKEQGSAEAPALLLSTLACMAASPSATAAASTSWYESTAPLRLSALEALLQGPPDALQSALQAPGPAFPCTLFQSLATCSQGDPSDLCRSAARSVLEAMHIGSAVIAPLLLAAKPLPAEPAAPDASQGGAKKKARGKKDSAPAVAEAAVPAPVGVPAPGTLELAVLVMELLQWKEVDGVVEVVGAAQELLGALQHSLAPITETHGGEDEDEGMQAAAAGQSAAEAAGKSSLAGYAAQLILSYLEVAVRAQAASPVSATPAKPRTRSGKGLLGALKLDLVVAVAQQAPDSGVRNAALSLLAALATHMPESVLDHVLQVLAVVNVSAAMTNDVHSLRVATSTLASVVPAWLSAGKDLTALWGAVVDALPSLPPHRRLGLLGALLGATPALESLPVALLLLLKAATQALLGPAAAVEAKGQEVSRHDWLLDLAAQLCLQVEPADRLVCLAGLIPLAVEAASGVPHEPLPRAVTSFVASQLQAKSVSAAHAMGGETDAELQRGCQAIMSAALAHVQALVTARETLQQPAAVAKTPSKSAKSKAAAAASTPAPLSGSALRKAERAAQVSIESVYGLFAALQGVMDSASYLLALLKLAEQPGNTLRRRALRLFADKARGLGPELEATAKHPALTVRAREEAVQKLLHSALQICHVVAATSGPASLHSASALTKQAGLVAYSGTVLAAGASNPQAVLAALPSVLTMVGDDSTAVRGSALAAVAAVARACGPQMVPLLPKVAQAVVAAAQRACKQLQGGTTSTIRAAEEGDEGERAEEEVAVELAAALAAADAMITTLGPFLSPYLPALLQVLLDPAVLACTDAGCASAAATARARLPKTVPARLLMQPLFGALPAAMEAGPEPSAALLGLVADAATGMEATVAATHHEAIFAFLLKALDVRHAAPAALVGHEHVVEQQAVSALVALTLKLSESRFKPLFLRLVEWGSSSQASGLGRTIALLSASAALAQKLRSVFVPYYKFLLDVCVRLLSSATAGVASTPAKKKRKAAEAGEAAVVEQWVARAKAVRALHRCFLYDTVGWLEADKVEKVLTPLVAQLSADIPAAAAAAISVQCADSELDGLVALGPRAPRDTYGVSTVAALVQLAMATNSDVHWKPLNHKVLMATRSPSARTRCLALEVVASLVDRLREEYLVLLPETLPFLSELLEDVETAVESRAQDILKQLEEISGEKLDEYLKTG